MKFGFGHVPTEHFEEHAALVEHAENLGFEYAWVPDQTFHRDPIALLARLAGRTKRIRLGVGVTNPYTRHPVVVARSAATLAEMAPGRISIGIGAGNKKQLLAPLGFDQGAAAGRCREAAELIRQLVAGKRVNFEGSFFRALDVQLELPAAPAVDVYLAGRGPRMLTAAGAVADGVIIGGLCTPKGIEFALDRVRAGCVDAGRQLADLQIVSWVTCVVTADRPSVLDRLRPEIAHIIGGAPDDVLEAIGLSREVVGKIKEVYWRNGIPAAAAHVTDECVDAFAIVGDGIDVAERITALDRVGVTQFSVLMPQAPIADHRRTLETFAESILPHFAESRAVVSQ